MPKVSSGQARSHSLCSFSNEIHSAAQKIIPSRKPRRRATQKPAIVTTVTKAALSRAAATKPGQVELRSQKVSTTFQVRKAVKVMSHNTANAWRACARNNL